MITDTHIYIKTGVQIPISEVVFQPIRAQGSGGQNVNKVSSAIQLRFDIGNSSLPDNYKEQLLKRADRRISTEGILVIKAQRFRTLEKNKEDALIRLQEIVREAGYTQKKRTPTKPNKMARKRRVDNKVKRGRIKALRGKVKE